MDQGLTKRAIYKSLPTSVTGRHWKLKPSKSGDTSQTFVDAFLARVLPKNRQNEKDMTYKTVSLEDKSKRIKKRCKKKRKTLSYREKKELKLFQIEPSEAKYELYLPLHELWKDYMRDLLNLDKVTSQNHAEAERKFVKADLHGCYILVAKSKCPSLNRLGGLVLQETKNTFKIVTKQNKLKILPKKGTTFSVLLEDYVFTIYGSNFTYKASDRAYRSFKLKPVVDLT